MRHGVFMFVALMALALPLLGVCDTLTFNGHGYRLSGPGPLEKHPDINRLRLKLKRYEALCWDCNCQYEAEWLVAGGELYLTGIKNCYGAEQKLTARLDVLFPGETRNGKVKATWLTGTLWASVGEPVYTFDLTLLYREELTFTIISGNVKICKRHEYPDADKGPFLDHPDAANRFIYQSINWDALPAYTGEKVFLTFQGGSGLADHIKVLRAPSDSAYAKEAIRVLSQMNWGILYRHGKPFKMQWTIPVVFSEEMRKRYSSALKIK